MRFPLFAAALLIATAPHLSAQSPAAEAPKDTQVLLRGCVMPALNNTYVLSDVTQAPGPNGAVMPEAAHGRRIVFWLKNDADVRKYPNKMVEVSGKYGALKESEAELKAGAHKDGGLVVEFEGPGRDVTASNNQVGVALGTAGRQTAEANDIKTYLAEVDVTGVKVVSETCN